MPLAYCGLASSSAAPNNTNECTTQYLNSTLLTTSFNSVCMDKTNCTVNINGFFLDPSTAPVYCTTNPAKVYIQYFCQEPNKVINQKRKDGLLISCAAAFSALVFLIVVYYLKKTAILDYQQWDIETLTASDFTVEYTITEDMWNLFIV